MTSFDLKGAEYIELNKLLKVLNLVETGGEAHALIDAGKVKVNAVTEKQRRKKVRPGDRVDFQHVVIEVK